MATDKMFKVAGVSNLNGTWKVRYASDIKRGDVLARNGHTDITFVEFDEPVLKVDAIDVLLGLDLGNPFANAAVKSEAREYGFLV